MTRRFTIFVFSLFFLTNLWANKSSNPLNFQFSETISERAKFLMYLDSVSKYLYRDAALAQEIIQECEYLLKTCPTLTNEDRLKFATEKIYIEQNNTQYLECYKIVKANEHFLQDNTISKKVKNRFTYIRAYTYFSLEDFTAAQKAFYQMIEQGRMEKDTSRIYSGLFSLGQLYNDKKNYESSIKCLLELAAIRQHFSIRTTSSALLDFELAETYTNLANYEQAQVFIEKGLATLETEKINRLKPDFLLLQGAIAVAKQDIKKAAKIADKAHQLSLELNDLHSLGKSRLFQAKVLGEQKKFQEAMVIYEALIAELDTNSLQKNSHVYDNAQAILSEMGDYQKAHTYLVQHRDIEQKIKIKEKKAQLAYLKVKYESEQKEKENQRLMVEVLQKVNRNRLLYLLSTIFILGFIVLFIAFYQKKKYNANLKEEVKKQTRDLAQSNEELAQSNEELERFTYITSHDLKTPLSNIINFAGLLEMELKAYAKEEHLSYLQFIKKGGARMNNLINDTLKFSSISHLKKENTVASINMNQLIIELKNSMTNLLESKQAKIIVQSPLPNMFAHRSSMNLLFQNLIENAIKYNESATPTITIYARQSPLFLSIFIEDNGIGIPAEYQDKIFVMFSRLHNHNKYAGTGLGLSICKKIISQLNGKILVKSKVNEGSTFEIRLPVNLIEVEPSIKA